MGKLDNELEKKFEDYSPVIWHVRRHFYLRGFSMEDWLQEARIVFYHSAERYDGRSAFGNYYRRNLEHHVIGLIRKAHAKKRMFYQECTIHGGFLTSEESPIYHLSAYRVSSMMDERLETKEKMEDWVDVLSERELQALLHYLREIPQSPNEPRTEKEKQDYRSLARAKKKLKKTLREE
ncbi:MAG: sigma-70 family RNA polymerase sigma factor [Lactobacillales bacterium]|nr:sigma-70 family RNA polymerase sigma factor [Lactobacillales bacterium]